MTELDERLDLAVAIALEASAIPRRHFHRNELVVDWKADDSPVTRADRDTEVLLRERIEAACPNDAIVGEEFPSKDGTTASGGTSTPSTARSRSSAVCRCSGRW